MESRNSLCRIFKSALRFVINTARLLLQNAIKTAAIPPRQIAKF
jgi:hypothetical protein